MTQMCCGRWSVICAANMATAYGVIPGRGFRGFRAGDDQQLKLRNEPVALFLVDQRMPRMSGVQFLEKARWNFTPMPSGRY